MFDFNTITYDYGHLEHGADTGADGFKNEYKEIRTYAPYAIALLIRAGYNLVNCTPPDNLGLIESLAFRAKTSNNAHGFLHICFHVNAFDKPTAHGAEVEYCSTVGAKYAQSVLSQIVNLGFEDRGIKNPSLYMTGASVNAVSILIEPFFCSSESDCILYNPVKLGTAIANGVLAIAGLKQPVIIATPIATPAPYVVPDNNDIAPDDVHVTKLEGGGWITKALDGRIILQQSRCTYLALHSDGELTVTHNGNTRTI